MAKIFTEDQKKMNEVRGLYNSQRNKEFNYSIDDFVIYDSQWKYKNWNTWCKGEGRYDYTKKKVEQYIVECKKPYGKRDLNFVHLCND